MLMEENIVLQVILHEGNGIEIRVGNDDKISPLMLVGILEQVKLNILGTAQTQEMTSEDVLQSKGPKYDA